MKIRPVCTKHHMVLEVANPTVVADEFDEDGWFTLRLETCTCPTEDQTDVTPCFVYWKWQVMS